MQYLGSFFSYRYTEKVLDSNSLLKSGIDRTAPYWLPSVGSIDFVQSILIRIYSLFHQDGLKVKN